MKNSIVAKVRTGPSPKSSRGTAHRKTARQRFLTLEHFEPRMLLALSGIPANCPSVLPDFDVGLLPEIGWTWVDAAHPIQSITGVVSDTPDEPEVSSFVTHTDFPTAHNSHDFKIHITTDPGQENL